MYFEPHTVDTNLGGVLILVAKQHILLLFTHLLLLYVHNNMDAFVLH